MEHPRAEDYRLDQAGLPTTGRYTHVATLQMKDASVRIDQALWGRR